MKSIRSFVKALNANYYSDFIVDPYSDFTDFSEQILLVRYKNADYYEKSLEAIHLIQREILGNVQSLYQKALTDIYIRLANKTGENFTSLLALNIQALKVTMDVLKSDFYIDDSKSRYYSKIVDSDYIGKAESRKIDIDNYPIDGHFIKIIKKWVLEDQQFRQDMEDYESFYHIGYHTKRFKVLSYLPFALWHISLKFIEDLKNAKSIISEQNETNLSGTKLKWTGKKTHIGFIIGTLAAEGYIDPPRLKNDDVNYTAFSKLIKQVFDVEVGDDTLRKYLNPDDEKFQENKATFEKENFHLPHKKLVT
jgi:hypothetical protein